MSQWGGIERRGETMVVSEPVEREGGREEASGGREKAGGGSGGG